MQRAPAILVIDDEIINLKTLQWILNEGGFRTVCTKDGESGRRILRENPFDLIILDVMMPGESGFEICAWLKKDPETSNIPVIFISGLDDVENKVKGLKLGAVDYITKPFASEEVLARVRLHIKLARALKAVIQEQAAKLGQIRDAQQSILVNPPDLPEARFGIRYIPVLEAGGDFYDVFKVTERSIGYFIADISGHDLGASFVTSSIKALIRQNSGPLFTPEETLRNMNSVLLTIFKDGKHLTACYAILNRAKRTLTLVSCGHPPAVLVSQGQARLLQSEGDILGVFPNIQLEVREIAVKPEDRIYLYTDGLVERFRGRKMNRDNGVELLCASCERARELEISAAVRQITAEMFPAGEKPEDDVVLLGVEV